MPPLTAKGTKIKVISKTERAYLAGILDGEGCISIGKRLEIYITPTVQVSNTRIELLEWLKFRFGGNIYINKEFRPNRKPHWNWSVAGQKALNVIKQARPFLLLKIQQADLLLALRRYKKHERDKLGRIKSEMTEKDFSENKLLIERMRFLNKRGVFNAINN